MKTAINVIGTILFFIALGLWEMIAWSFVLVDSGLFLKSFSALLVVIIISGSLEMIERKFQAYMDKRHWRVIGQGCRELFGEEYFHGGKSKIDLS